MARFIHRVSVSQMSPRAVAALEYAMAGMMITVAGLGAVSTSGQQLADSLSKITGMF